MAIERNKRAFLATPSLRCPDCGAPMRLLTITPSESQPVADEIVHRCEVCSIDMTDVDMKDVTLQPAA
jgi:hypothetical protein